MQEKLKPRDEKSMRKEIWENLYYKGIFKGYKKTLIRTNSEKFPYAIEHQCDLFGLSSEHYENLYDAIYDFIELMKVYG